jgi:hypothetical protein
MTLIAAILLFCRLALAYPDEPAQYSPFFEEEGVVVEIAREGTSIPWIRATGVVAFPCEDLMARIGQVADYGKIFSEAVDGVKALDVDKAIDSGNAADGPRFHVVWGLPFPMRDRDAVVRYTQTGPLLLSWRDAAQSGDPQTGVRIEKVSGYTKLVPRSKTECGVTYAYYGDLGGDLPEFIKQRAWKHEPIYYFAVLRQR